LEINDDSSDDSIVANPTLELDNDIPVSSIQAVNQTLKAIWGFDERVLGCGDPARPGAVYFSKRGNGDSWPPQNWIQTAETGGEAMNGLVYAERCFVFSRERLIALVPNVIQGVTFTPQETSCRRGLKGRFGFCIGKKGIYFWSKDGVYRTQGGPEESVVDDSIRPLFATQDSPGRDVNGYEAVDMSDENGLRMSFHNNEIWCHYTGATSGERKTLIYDEDHNRWRAIDSTVTVNMGYSEPDVASNLLLGMSDGDMRQGGGASDADGDVDVNVRTGSFDQGQPLALKRYGNVIFDLDPNNATVTITPYLDANALPQAAIVVTGNGRQRVALALDDVFGLNVSFDISWSTDLTDLPVLFQIDIMYAIEPAAMKHWFVSPSSYGFEGWLHVRDSYVVLRSTDDVTMTLTPDNGAAQVFVIPTTAGAKKKIYVPFAANKERLLSFAFDSDADFRIYTDECELRAKQWLTGLGYKNLPIFAAQGPS
jgi:hypothetical protein